jgi:hypothetical protein
MMKAQFTYRAPAYGSMVLYHYLWRTHVYGSWNGRSLHMAYGVPTSMVANANALWGGKPLNPPPPLMCSIHNYHT